jgi:hypothetical protein
MRVILEKPSGKPVWRRKHGRDQNEPRLRTEKYLGNWVPSREDSTVALR